MRAVIGGTNTALWRVFLANAQPHAQVRLARRFFLEPHFLSVRMSSSCLGSVRLVIYTSLFFGAIGPALWVVVPEAANWLLGNRSGIYVHEEFYLFPMNWVRFSRRLWDSYVFGELSALFAGAGFGLVLLQYPKLARPGWRARASRAASGALTGVFAAVPMVIPAAVHGSRTSSLIDGLELFIWLAAVSMAVAVPISAICGAVFPVSWKAPRLAAARQPTGTNPL